MRPAGVEQTSEDTAVASQKAGSHGISGIWALDRLSFLKTLSAAETLVFSTEAG
jgi:hypothetical protein